MNIDAQSALSVSLRLCASVVLLVCAVARAAGNPAAKLSSGEYFIQQSWTREQDFQRPYHVNVPANPENRKLPVVIFLHGNGGNAGRAMNSFLKQWPSISARFVTAFPDGDRESWNISAERSKADDQ